MIAIEPMDLSACDRETETDALRCKGVSGNAVSNAMSCANQVCCVNCASCYLGAV